MQVVLTQVEPGQSVFQLQDWLTREPDAHHLRQFAAELQYWLTLGPEAQKLPHSKLELQYEPAR